MFEKVCEILADKFDADASTMTMETKVKEDLNADSLDVVELMMDLEENFGVAISDEEAAEMSTIGDIVKYIEDHKESSLQQIGKRLRNFVPKPQSVEEVFC